MSKAQAVFVVVLNSTEPPPGWAEHSYKKISREIELMYGKNARVLVAPAAIVEYLMVDATVLSSPNGLSQDIDHSTPGHTTTNGEL